MSTDFQVTVHGPRGEEWKAIAGTDRFPVKSPIPILANLPGIPEPVRAFLLDTEAVDPVTLQRILNHLSRKFQMSEEETAKELAAAGIPILDQDCSVVITNPMKWLSDDGDPDGDDYDEDDDDEFDLDEDDYE